MTRSVAELAGYRAVLSVPMRREGETVGAISVTRIDAGAFAAHEVDLLETFASQAVIAIENARLFNETQEALERQTATAEILKVIASSPTDVQPVFDAIAERANRLLRRASRRRSRFDDELHAPGRLSRRHARGRRGAARPFPTPLDGARQCARDPSPARSSRSPTSGSTRVRAESARWRAQRGWRSALAVPMRRDGVRSACSPSPARARPFPPTSRSTLLQTFADQAVIAIENVRLFNETKEALEQQTATAEILRVISGSVDRHAAGVRRDRRELPAPVRRQARVPSRCRAASMIAVASPRERRADEVDATPPAVAARPRQRCRRLHPRRARDRGRRHRRGDAEFRACTTWRSRCGYRSCLFVPLLRERQGDRRRSRSCARRRGAFDRQESRCLQTFADQAVIAIENVRLFNETKEALERQTATAEILRSSAARRPTCSRCSTPIAERAGLLCGADASRVWLASMASMLRWRRHDGPRLGAARDALPRCDPRRTSVAGRRSSTAACEIETSCADRHRISPTCASSQRGSAFAPCSRCRCARRAVDRRRSRCARRSPARSPTTEIGLLQTFADQAVIAIENVRLFNETKEALERQTATAEVLQAISSSVADTPPVFDKILPAASGCSAATQLSVFLVDDQERLAHRRDPRPDPERDRAHAPALSAAARRHRDRAGDPRAPAGRASPTSCTIPDVPRPAPDRQAARATTRAVWSCRCCGRARRSARSWSAAPSCGAFDDKEQRLLQHLRRPGGDRDRERAPVQRDPGGARAPDGDGRRPARHQRVADRRAAGVRRDRRAARGACSTARAVRV